MNIIGFDIGGTKCACILGWTDNPDTEMVIVDKIKFPTGTGPDVVIAELFKSAEIIMNRNGLENQDISGIGISCGGPLDSRNGIILSPPNLPGWDNIHIVKMTENHFGIRTLVQNDANACAIAEWKYGAGRGFNNIVFLTFGTGMGAGLILDGRLYSGTTDLAGEVGHIRLSENGPVGFGKEGSFEGWCSGGGIAQLGQIYARKEIQMGRHPLYCNSLEDLETVTAKSIADAAYQGDKTAVMVYNTVAEYLGKGLATIIDIINPQVIILGSIYGRTRSLIEKEMMRAVEKESISYSYTSCRIVTAGLGEQIGDMAALTLGVESLNKNK